MYRIFLATLLGTLLLVGGNPKSLLGEWTTQRSFQTGNEKHLEREDLRFNPDTFRLMLTVTIEKGNLLVKDLKIRASGLWKLQGETLVLVVEQISFASVARTKGINKNSFERLVRDLRGRYLDDPIRILKLRSLDSGTLTLETADHEIKSYKRTGTAQ
jgi:hypothetical protein